MKKILLFSLVLSSYLNAVSIVLNGYGDLYSETGEFKTQLENIKKTNKNYYYEGGEANYFLLDKDFNTLPNSSNEFLVGVDFSKLIVKANSSSTLTFDFSDSSKFKDIEFTGTGDNDGYISLGKNANLIIKSSGDFTMKDEIYLGAGQIYFTPNYNQALKEKNTNSSLSIEAKNININRDKQYFTDLKTNKEYGQGYGSVLVNGSKLNLKASESINFGLYILDTYLAPSDGEYKSKDENYWLYENGSYNASGKTEQVKIGDNIQINFQAPVVTNTGALYASGSGGSITINGEFKNQGKENLTWDNKDFFKIYDGFDGSVTLQTKVFVKDGASLNVNGNFTNDTNAILSVLDGSSAKITGNFVNNGWLVLGLSDEAKNATYLDVVGNITINDTSNLVYATKKNELLSENNVFKLAQATGSIEDKLKSENIHLIDLANNGTYTDLKETKFFQTSIEKNGKEWYLRIGVNESVKDKTLEEIIQGKEINNPNNSFDKSIELINLVPNTKKNYASIIKNDNLNSQIAQAFYSSDRVATIQSIMSKPEILQKSVDSYNDGINSISKNEIAFIDLLHSNTKNSIQNRLYKIKRSYNPSVAKQFLISSINYDFYAQNNFWLESNASMGSINSNNAKIYGVNFGFDKQNSNGINGIFFSFDELKHNADFISINAKSAGLGYYFYNDLDEKLSFDFDLIYKFLKVNQTRMASVFDKNKNFDSSYLNHYLNIDANLLFNLNLDKFTLRPFVGVELLFAKMGDFNENQDSINLSKARTNAYAFNGILGAILDFDFYKTSYITLKPYLKQNFYNKSFSANYFLDNLKLDLKTKKLTTFGLSSELNIPFNDNMYFNFGLGFYANDIVKNMNANIGFKLKF